MKENDQLLTLLTEKLMKEVMQYGILSVSLEQYQVVCNAIVKYAAEQGIALYSSKLMESYRDHLDNRVSSNDICTEYQRFQLRVIRMLTSLAETGKVDFSSTHSHPIKYLVSDTLTELVEKILDSYPVSEATKRDLRAPTRHFLWFAAEQGIKPEDIDDPLVMKFLIDEIPITNGGSTGRTLRCVKYATEYLKKHGNHSIRRDYTLLTLKNDHRRIIPAYSENEIHDIVNAAKAEETLEKRDLAIILFAYCTGLRGIDIIKIKLTDIDWHNNRVLAVQSKTHEPVISKLNGTTMNALAEYILDWRPECSVPEVFVTVKAPYRSLSKGFGNMIDKYCRKAEVPKISFRGFHSLRRSFETVMISKGVPIEIASQMLGHKRIDEDKPYLTYDKQQSAFVAMDFSDVPITTGFYAGRVRAALSGKEGDDI